MKFKIVLIIVIVLSYIFMEFIQIYAFSQEENYLWIEFHECVREKDGSVILPLQINYGRFPDKKEEGYELDSLKAFYSLVEKDNKAAGNFYRAKIERDNGKNLVKIKSFTENRFIVFVEAKISHGETTHWYFAKTSVVLFGHASFKREQMKPVLDSEINRQMEIFVSPQFHYWPQTGEPVVITPLFNKEYLHGEVICLFDENMPLAQIVTDEKGSFTYVPPQDKKLNSQGETAFKQAVILAEKNESNNKYISSYTLLLHRSRFKNRNLFLGAGIFGGNMAVVFLSVIIKRRRFKV